MSDDKYCRDCIYYRVIAHKPKGGDKAECKYSVMMKYEHSKACKRHYSKKES